MISFNNKKTPITSYIPMSRVNPSSAVTEQYRKLRTNIEFLNINQDIKVISITSAMPIEGKTTTAINLATVYAQSNLKTLLIDMDLRKPKIHRGFGISNVVGLSNIITEQLNIDDVIHQENEFLYILNAGAKLPFPAEFLMSEKVKLFIANMKQNFDRIIIDTPPMTFFSDAAIISRFSDGVIIAIASNKLDVKTAKSLIKDIEISGAFLIGSVLTQFVKKNNKKYGYNSYAYHEKS